MTRHPDTNIKPRRIQRQRSKGWQMPENTVYVGRPTEWGNPYFVGHNAGSYEEAVVLYRADKDKGLYRIKIKNELRGKNLCCWCPLNRPCHADVLLEIAND